MGKEKRARRARRQETQGRGRRGDRSRAELYFGDGKGARRDRKDAQLCKQIRDALDLALAGRLERALISASVDSVEPAPHIGHLRVLVDVQPDDEDGLSTAEVLDNASTCLRWIEGELRAEVAASIHRKKTPSLSFVVRSRVRSSLEWPSGIDIDDAEREEDS